MLRSLILLASLSLVTANYCAEKQYCAAVGGPCKSTGSGVSRFTCTKGSWCQKTRWAQGDTSSGVCTAYANNQACTRVSSSSGSSLSMSHDCPTNNGYECYGTSATNLKCNKKLYPGMACQSGEYCRPTNQLAANWPNAANGYTTTDAVACGSDNLCPKVAIGGACQSSTDCGSWVGDLVACTANVCTSTNTAAYQASVAAANALKLSAGAACNNAATGVAAGANCDSDQQLVCTGVSVDATGIHTAASTGEVCIKKGSVADGSAACSVNFDAVTGASVATNCNSNARSTCKSNKLDYTTGLCVAYSRPAVADVTDGLECNAMYDADQQGTSSRPDCGSDTTCSCIGGKDGKKQVCALNSATDKCWELSVAYSQCVVTNKASCDKEWGYRVTNQPCNACCAEKQAYQNCHLNEAAFAGEDAPTIGQVLADNHCVVDESNSCLAYPISAASGLSASVLLCILVAFAAALL